MGKVEPIEGVDLKELLQETAQEIVLEKKRSTQRLMRILLDRLYVLKEEIIQAKKHLVNKEEAIKKIEEKITRLRDGDWSVLEGLDLKPEEKDNKNG